MDDELHVSSDAPEGAQHDSRAVIPEDLERLPPATATEPPATEPEEAVPKAEPKKRGRPVCSKNKEPGKPRAPRVKKVAIVPEPVEPPSTPAEPQPVEARSAPALLAPQSVETPRVLPGSRPIPRDPYDDNTRLMLMMLQQQAQNRKTRKVEQWKSWFR